MRTAGRMNEGVDMKQSLHSKNSLGYSLLGSKPMAAPSSSAQAATAAAPDIPELVPPTTNKVSRVLTGVAFSQAATMAFEAVFLRKPNTSFGSNWRKRTT